MPGTGDKSRGWEAAHGAGKWSRGEKTHSWGRKQLTGASGQGCPLPRPQTQAASRAPQEHAVSLTSAYRAEELWQSKAVAVWLLSC